MKTFSERVAYAVERVGGQTEMARKCTTLRGEEVRQSNIRYLIKGRGDGSVPAFSGLTPFIAAAAGLSTDWLATGEGKQERTEDDDKNFALQHLMGVVKRNSSELHSILVCQNLDELAGGAFSAFPLLKINVSAGPGEEVVEVDVESKPILFPNQVIQNECLEPGECGVMFVTGNSMYPQFADGDCVLIDYKRKNILDNKVYALIWKGEHFLKRLCKEADGGLEIISDNKIGNPDKIIPAEYVHDIYIVGRAIAKIGKVY